MFSQTLGFLFAILISVILSVSCTSLSIATTNELQFRSLNIFRLFDNDVPNSKKPNSCRERLLDAFNQNPNETISFFKFIYQSSASPEVMYLNGDPPSRTTNFGDYDRCLYNSKWNATKYCLISLRRKNAILNDVKSLYDHNLPLTITRGQVPYAFGVCLPEHCSGANLIDLLLEQQDSPQQVSVLESLFEIILDNCQSNVSYSQTPTQQASISVKAIAKTLQDLCPLAILPLTLSAIIAFSTFLDWLKKASNSTPDNSQLLTYLNFFANFIPEKVCQFLLCFSLLKNARKLFRIDSKEYSGHKKNPLISQRFENDNNNLEKRNNCLKFDKNLGRNVVEPLRFLDGIRLLSIFWIMISHCVSFTHIPYLMNISPFSNHPTDLMQISQNSWILSSYFLSTYFPVSIFFMISGVLVIYNQPKNRKNNCQVSEHLFRYLTRRLFRILPVFMVIIFVTYNLDCLGNGPLFTSGYIEPFIRSCKQHLWTHLTLIHNWWPISERCGSHTWFISADFQLHCLSFIIVHLLRCKSQMLRGFSILIGLLCISTLIPLLLVAFDYGQIPDFNVFIMPNLAGNAGTSSRDLQLFYYATYMHAPAFLLGILLGYILSSNWCFDFLQKNESFRNGSLVLSVGCLILSPLAMKLLVFESTFDKCWTAVLFEAISYAFHISLFWMFLIMALNPRLLLSKSFGASFLRPFSKCVYSLYLVHQPLIWFTVYQTRFPISINIFTLITFTTTIIGISIPISFILYLAVEAPFINIVRLLFTSAVNSRATKQRDEIKIELDNI